MTEVNVGVIVQITGINQALWKSANANQMTNELVFVFTQTLSAAPNVQLLSAVSILSTSFARRRLQGMESGEFGEEEGRMLGGSGGSGTQPVSNILQVNFAVTSSTVTLARDDLIATITSTMQTTLLPNLKAMKGSLLNAAIGITISLIVVPTMDPTPSPSTPPTPKPTLPPASPLLLPVSAGAIVAALLAYVVVYTDWMSLLKALCVSVCCPKKKKKKYGVGGEEEDEEEEVDPKLKLQGKATVINPWANLREPELILLNPPKKKKMKEAPPSKVAPISDEADEEDELGAEFAAKASKKPSPSHSHSRRHDDESKEESGGSLSLDMQLIEEGEVWVVKMHPTKNKPYYKQVNTGRVTWSRPSSGTVVPNSSFKKFVRERSPSPPPSPEPAVSPGPGALSSPGPPPLPADAVALVVADEEEEGPEQQDEGEEQGEQQGEKRIDEEEKE